MSMQVFGSDGARMAAMVLKMMAKILEGGASSPTDGASPLDGSAPMEGSSPPPIEEATPPATDSFTSDPLGLSPSTGNSSPGIKSYSKPSSGSGLSAPRKAAPAPNAPAGSSGGMGKSSAAAGPAPSAPNASMQKLAQAGKSAAARRNTKGRCLAGVDDALQATGIGRTGQASAYQAANVLARNPKMKEIKTNNLKSLPPGAVIVWDRSANNPHGHISITQGNGQESSDNLKAISAMNTPYRVFVPQG